MTAKQVWNVFSLFAFAVEVLEDVRVRRVRTTVSRTFVASDDPIIVFEISAYDKTNGRRSSMLCSYTLLELECHNSPSTFYAELVNKLEKVLQARRNERERYAPKAK